MSFDLFGLILNPTVLAEDERVFVNDEDQSNFKKYPPVPESPFRAKEDLSYVKVLYCVLSFTGPPYSLTF